MKGEIKITGRKLEITRVFAAPRAMVFAWWTKPENLRQWSGCKEAVNCEFEMDFRVGGGFKQTMQIGDKGQFTITGEYEEIVAPQRIVYRANLGPMATRVTVTLFEQGNQTRMVLTHEGFTDDMTIQFVSQGTSESFDKLETLLSAAAAVAKP
jgi:uncharacterized protein YndB with AHSA1/START domain